MTNDGTAPDAELVVQPFNAVDEQNDYEASASENTNLLPSSQVVDVHLFFIRFHGCSAT